MVAIITVVGVAAALVPAAGSSAGAAPRFAPVLRGFTPGMRGFSPLVSGFGTLLGGRVPRFHGPRFFITPPLIHGNGACEIASGRCSLKPCVDSIASFRAPAGLSAPVPALRIARPAIRRSAPVCRHPAPILISTG